MDKPIGQPRGDIYPWPMNKTVKLYMKNILLVLIKIVVASCNSISGKENIYRVNYIDSLKSGMIVNCGLYNDDKSFVNAKRCVNRAIKNNERYMVVYQSNGLDWGYKEEAFISNKLQIIRYIYEVDHGGGIHENIEICQSLKFDSGRIRPIKQYGL